MLKNYQNVKKQRKKTCCKKDLQFFLPPQIFFSRNEISYPENPRNQKNFSIGCDFVKQLTKNRKTYRNWPLAGDSGFCSQKQKNTCLVFLCSIE